MVYCIPFHHEELGGPAMFDSGEEVINERKKVHNTNVETKIDKVCRMDISIATATSRLGMGDKGIDFGRLTSLLYTKLLALRCMRNCIVMRLNRQISFLANRR